MKVSELIEALQKMPQDAKVLMSSEDRGDWDNEVRDVIYNGHTTKDDPHTVELDNWPKHGY